MAHVLHDGHHRDDDRDCSDRTGRGDRTGDVAGVSDEDRRDRRRRRRRRERLIPVGTISIDCSPVSFRTPGQARNVLSCPFTVTELVTEVQTTFVETPTDFGCVLVTPVTQTVQVPVTTTVNCPGVLVPIPQIICPENVLGVQEDCPCPTTVAATTPRHHKRCGCR
ncbi:MAG TPA: hypothetical protein VD973_26405 [Symbiobacteriaceae bacterium]|nr:hypothetical protein [Symbiobacteriaceae bacterium]